MEFGARDVHEKQFNDSWRGYSQEEVDEFLDRVAETIENLHRENHALKERMAELDQAVSASRNTEEMLKKTLVSAQRAAEEAIGTAKAKAEALVSEAEERARHAADEAGRRVAQAEREHEARRRHLDASIERLRAFEAELKQRLKAFLEQQQQALDALDANRPRPALRATPDTGTKAKAEAPPAEGAPPRTITLHHDRAQ